MEARIIYITTEDKAEARNIGKVLVEERLAACVNIIDGMESMFWWEGEAQSEKETILIAKTTADRLDDLTVKVKEVHSYDCPCIVALPIQGGNPDFLSWIAEEVHPKSV